MRIFHFELNYFQPNFSGLCSTKLWCVLGTQREPPLDSAWLGGDGSFSKYQWCSVMVAVTYIWRMLWRMDKCYSVSLNVTFSLSSNSHVLCCEPHLNPAGRDPTSAISYSSGHGWVRTWSRIFEGGPLVFNYVSHYCAPCPSPPGPMRVGSSVWSWDTGGGGGEKRVLWWASQLRFVSHWLLVPTQCWQESPIWAAVKKETANSSIMIQHGCGIAQ